MRILVVLFCVVLVPVVARAQTPAPASFPSSALQAAATLARMSDATFSLDSAVANDTKKKKDQRTLGIALMVAGVAAIVGGIAYGGNGGLAIIIAGGILEGYGYTLYHGGK